MLVVGDGVAGRKSGGWSMNLKRADWRGRSSVGGLALSPVQHVEDIAGGRSGRCIAGKRKAPARALALNRRAMIERG